VEVTLKELHEVLDRVHDVEVAGLADGELASALVELGALRARVAAAEAKVAGE